MTNPISLLVLLVAVVTAVDGACDLVCHNNGTCVEGGPIDSGSNATTSASSWNDDVAYNSSAFLEERLNQHCVCAEGYVGTLCEYQVANCSLPCQNGGVCVPGGHSVLPLYNSSFLDDDVVYNTSSTYNTSSGYNTSSAFNTLAFVETQVSDYCECPVGYFGALCEYTTWNCSLACQNGGVCVQGGHFESYATTFYNSSGFLDDDAAYNTTSSVYSTSSSANSTPAFVEIQENNYCECPLGYFGPLCEYTIGNCTLDCQNGGVCVPGGHSVLDLHNSSFLDDDAVSNTSSANNTPAFVEIQVSDYCECPVGYYGALCEYAYTTLNCSLDCQNGGVCVQGGRYESYDDDFYNSSWFLDDDAANKTSYVYNTSSVYNTSAISNTSSVSSTSTFLGGPLLNDYCECPNGYVGAFCEEKAANCSVACQNGGVCVQVVVTEGNDDVPADFHNATGAAASYDYCQCPFGFVGSRCEIPQVVCGNDDHYCYNGGTCFKTGCVCPVNYTGVSCETAVGTMSSSTGAPTNQSSSGSSSSFENSTTTAGKRGSAIDAITHAIANSSAIPSDAPATKPSPVESITSEAATTDKTSGAFQGRTPLMRIVALLALLAATF